MVVEEEIAEVKPLELTVNTEIMDESQVIHLKSSVIDAFSLPPIGSVPKQ